MGLVQCIKWGKELLTATGVTSYLLLGLLAQLKGSFETVDDLGATDRLLLETLVLNSVDIEDINVLLQEERKRKRRRERRLKRKRCNRSRTK